MSRHAVSSAPDSPRGLPAVLALAEHPVVRRLAAVCRQELDRRAPGRGEPGPRSGGDRAVADSAAYLVGGMVRDAWLGRPTRDFDAVVHGRGEEIARRLADELPATFVPLGGKEFAAFRLVGDGFELDLWDRQGTTTEGDLARRDLTLNAVAVDLLPSPAAASPILDPFGGLEDLERGLLRAVTPDSFSGDPLRVLRLPRFAAQLPGFTSDGPTRSLARAAAPELPAMAAERVRVEMEKLLAAEGAGRGLEELAALGLYPALFLDPPAIPPDAAGADRGASPARHPAREMDELPAAARRLGALLPGSELDAPPLDLPAARLASAMVGLPGAEGGEELLNALRLRGWLSRRQVDPALPLVRDPVPPPRGAEDETERRLALHRQGEVWTTALAWWGARSQAAAREGEAGASRLRAGVEALWDEPWEEGARQLLELLARDGERILDPPRLLTGDEVQELLGIPPGPELGEVLADLRRAQVEGRVATRGEAVGWLESRRGG